MTNGTVRTSSAPLRALLDKDKLLDSVFRISALLKTPVNLDEILSRILDELVDAIGFERGIIRLFDEPGQNLVAKVVKNYSPEEASHAFASAVSIAEDCLVTKVARSGEMIMIEDAEHDSRLTAADRMLTKLENRGSIICAPLRIEERVIGTMTAWLSRETIFFPEEIRLYQAFASQAGIVIHNARLFEADGEKIRQLLILQESAAELYGSHGETDIIFDVLVRRAAEITGAERVLLFLRDTDGRRSVINDGGKVTIRDGAAAADGSGVSLVDDAMQGTAVPRPFAAKLPDDRHAVSSPAELALPFRIRDLCRGILYLAKNVVFSEDETHMLDILLKNAATAYDNAVMHSLLFREAETLKSEVEKLKEREERLLGFHDIIGKSPKMTSIFGMISEVAHHNTNVLIQGESGTGKELIARAIHRQSPRSNKAFVDVNCAAIPPTLLESELFGYEAGAFTDARKKKIGLLEFASGGTMLLDEVGDMSIHLQAKFLRMLEDGHIRRLGGTENVPIDVRFVFSTNRDLASMVTRGSFRGDLYYRIRVVPISIPPLRERKEDILRLAQYFLQEFSQKYQKRLEAFDPEAEKILLDYPWPGNVRELKNIVERLLILKKEGRIVTPEDLPTEICREAPENGERADRLESLLRQFPEEGLDYIAVTEQLAAEMRQRILQSALDSTGGNKSEAARRLKISRYKFLREEKRGEERGRTHVR